MNEIRLIDANALFERIGQIKPKNKQQYEDIGLFMNMITNAPTVFTCNACKNMGNERECVDCHDYSNYVHYEERPQGEWVTERKYYDDFLKNIIYECSCSVCGARFPFDQIPETTQDAFYSFNYCPACGAKTRTDAD